VHFLAAALPRRLPSASLLCMALLILNGCVNVSEISRSGADDYAVTATGLSYTKPLTALDAEARTKAAAHCTAQDLDMQVRQQVRGWRPMEVTLVFRCVPHRLDQSAASAR
jgi:hypothetical protein